MQNITENIIQQAVEGDEQAFEKIYKAYFQFVSNVTYRIINKTDEVEDICQEVFMIIYRKLSSFRYESSLKTWIYRITINCALKYAQRKAKEKENMVEFNEHMPIQSDLKNIRNQLDDKQNEEMVQGLLNKLTIHQRTCIVLRSIQGLSYKEIASVLKIPINTVRSRIKRAREAMIALRSEVIHNEL